MTRTVVFTTADQLRVPLQVRGHGPPLVIVPGWTSNAADWEPVIRRLTPRFRCYIWSNRALLDGPNPGVSQMGRDLADMLRALNLHRPMLLGHSMGAATVWEHVRQFGCDHLGRLVFIDQSPKLLTDKAWSLGLFGGFGADDNDAFVAALRLDFTATVMRLIGSSRTEPAQGVVARMDSRYLEARRQYIDSLLPEPWIHCWESLAAADCRDVLSTITVPTLLAYGALSAFYGPRVAAWVQEQIPKSRLHLYANSGHSPHLEDMTAFVDDLIAFGQVHHAE